MRRPKNRTIVITAALVVAAWLVFRPRPVPVEVGAVDRGPLVVTVDEEGETRVRDRYAVVAPVSAWLERLALDEGDTVREGQVVARLFPRALEPREREAAQGRLASARASLAAARARREEAAAALAQARRDRERVQRLANDDLVPAQELERARTDEAVRAAALAAADATVAASSGDVAAARAALLQAATSPGSLLALRAPIGGTVLRVIEEGGREVAAGTPILELGDPAALEVVVDVLSSDAARVAPGAEMLLAGWGGEDTLRATVRAVEPSGFTKVSPLGVEEQRVNVVADVTDPPAGLGDRYRVDVRVVTWRGEGVLRVPTSALWRRGEGWAAFVVVGGRAHIRDLRVGHRGEGWTQVVTGLEEGDIVVLHPGEEVADGVRVAPLTSPGSVQ